MLINLKQKVEFTLYLLEYYRELLYNYKINEINRVGGSTQMGKLLYVSRN